ncbi:hypothetical protein HZS_3699 [Henneguya salminicola]|nr:hypothetical protein HZS_3699 [Henneguya salminicola]
MNTLVEEFERDCQTLDVGTGNSSVSRDVHLANQKLLRYHSVERAYNISFSVLLNSKNKFTLYQAVILADVSLMKEWDTFTIQNLHELLTKLFEIFNILTEDVNYIAVLRRFCYLLAKVCKRGHSHFFENFVQSIVESTANLLITHANPLLELTYFTLIHSIILEYSEVKASFAYITFEDMINFRMEFETKYLFLLLKLTMDAILARIVHGTIHVLIAPIYNRQLLQCLESIMSWRFNLTKNNFKYIWLQESQINFEPPEYWAETMEKYDICLLIFYIFGQFYSDSSLCEIAASCFIQYSSLNIETLNNKKFIAYHINNYNQKFTELVPLVCNNPTPNAIWCICSGMRRFQESPIKVKTQSDHNINYIDFSLDKSDYLTPIIQHIVENLSTSEEASDIYIDAANEFCCYVQNIRETINKNNYPESFIATFSQNLDIIGRYIIERDLICPLGHLPNLELKVYGFSVHNDQLKFDKTQHSWVEDCGYSFICHFPFYLSQKLNQIIDQTFSLFLSEDAEIRSHIPELFYNTEKIIGFFINTLIDYTSDCFMYFAILYLINPNVSKRRTKEFVRCYLEWQNDQNFDKSPKFISQASLNINAHVQFFVFVLIIWQLYIEYIKNVAFPEQIIPALNAIHKFLYHFPLFFEKVTVLNYKNGVLNTDKRENCVKFIDDNHDRCAIISILVENCYFLFKFLHNITTINDQCSAILIRACQTVHRYSLFDAKWTVETCTKFLDILMESLQNSSQINQSFIKNLVGVIVISASYCRLKNGHEKFSRELRISMQPKFSREGNDFPSLGFISQDSKILEHTWLLNISFLEGVLVSFQVPKHTEKQYPLLIGLVFQDFHKILAGVIIKGGSNNNILLKYVVVIQKFINLFKHYSAANLNFLQHIELIEMVCNTYFLSIQNRIPCKNIKDEKNILKQTLKIYRAFASYTVSAIHVADSITFNRSSTDDPNVSEKLFYSTKNILFNLLVNSNDEFFMIPKFAHGIFDAVSEFIQQYKCKIKKLCVRDLECLIKYIAMGVKSDCLDRKCQLFQSIGYLVKSLNAPEDTDKYYNDKNRIEPLINVIIEIMAKEPISLDLLDYFCNAFLYLIKYYYMEVLKFINIFLTQSHTIPSVSSNIYQLIDIIHKFSAETTNLKYDFDLALVIHHFLNLISILRNQNHFF